MADVDVKVDQRKFKELRAMLANFPRQIPKISNRAINKVATWARTRIVREVARDIGVKQSDIRKKTPLKRSTRSTLRARIGISGKRIMLHKFKARELKRGVSYRIGSGGRKKIREAFIATMKSGHVGVFKRKGKKRLGITELRGPSIGQAYANIGRLGQYLLRRAAERLDREISTQAELFLAKKARKTG